MAAAIHNPNREIANLCEHAGNKCSVKNRVSKEKKVECGVRWFGDLIRILCQGGYYNMSFDMARLK